MATDQVLTLSSADDEIDLYTWINNGVDAPGFEALAGIEGFGMTDQTNRWFDGAGEGSQYLGSRVLAREYEIPLWAKERDRDGLNELLSRLSLMLSPRNAPIRLNYGLPGGKLWYSEVVREAGGDYIRSVKGSNRRTWLKSSLTLKAGDPYWTRDTPENIVITEDTSGRGLLPDLAKLELSYSGAFGNLQVINPGDAEGKPFWTFNGPFTKITMIGNSGQQLIWEGDVLENEKIFIDTRRATVKDHTGANRYDGLADSPKFWKIAPRVSRVVIVLEGTGPATYGLGQWWPRRWAVV